MRAKWGGIAVVALVHIILAGNAILHDPHVGYDAGDHWAYVETLSEARLPLPNETREFFCPPLPYVIPALLRSLGMATPWAQKAAQGVNVLFSLALFAALLGIAQELRPGDRRFAIWAVALLGMFPVYYRSFVQLRGEPLLAALVVTSVWLTLRVSRRNDAGWRAAALLGATLGGVLLSRQWGGFVLIAVAAYFALLAWREPARRSLHAQSLAVALAVAVLVSGWFYARHAVRFGSVAAFNRAPESLSTQNQPASFYLGTGDGDLFRKPVREAFPNQFLPIFYSEVWGDYWSYFVVRQPTFGPLRGGRPHVGSNKTVMAPYLGRVNAVSVLPSVFFVVAMLAAVARLPGLIANRSPPNPDFALEAGRALLLLCVVCSMAGFAWFLIRYPIPERGDTIKATYMLQVFPFVALLGADLLVRVRAIRPLAYRTICFVLIAAWVHHLPIYFTRYQASLPEIGVFPGGRVETLAQPHAEGVPGGILAEYFHGTGFQQSVRFHDKESVRVHSQVRPIVGVNADRFSVRWSGWLNFPADGKYVLCSESDDGARLSLGGRKLIDDWEPHAVRTVCESVRVRAGWARFEAEFHDHQGLAHLRILRGPSRAAAQVIPARYFCCRKPDETPAPPDAETAAPE